MSLAGCELVTSAEFEEPSRCRDCGGELEMRRPCLMFRRGGVIVAAICLPCSKTQDTKEKPAPAQP